MEEILTYRRYKEMIETCERLQSPETVRAHITAYLKKYQNDNPTMAIAMMEIIESENPSIDTVDDEWLEDISSFVDLEGEQEQPQLCYLYTILMNSDSVVQNSQPVDDSIDVSEVHFANTFKSSYSDKELEQLRIWLIDQGYIKPIERDIFSILFSNKAISELKGRKLQWNLTATSGNANSVIFTLIYKIAPKELENTYTKSRFYKKIENLIEPANSGKFKTPTLSKAFGQWEKRKLSRIKRLEVDKNSQALIEFIDSLSELPA